MRGLASALTSCTAQTRGGVISKLLAHRSPFCPNRAVDSFAPEKKLRTMKGGLLSCKQA